MNNNTLLNTGIVGTVITAVCCFTPLLAMLLGAFGLSSITGYLDLVLLPVLVMFIAMTFFAVTKRRKQPSLVN